MPTITRETNNLDRLPPERPDSRVAPWAKPQPRDTWDVVLARAGAVCGITGFASLLTWIAAPQALPFVVLGGIGLYAAAWAKRHVIYQFEDVRGVPIASHQLAKVNPVAALDDQSLLAGLLREGETYAGAVVPAQQTYSPTITYKEPQALPQAAEIKALEAAPALLTLAPADWLARLDEQPHAIFAAKTKGGKSTMAKFGMQPRIARGESFFVIDPHSNGWLDLPSVGGGLRWNEVSDAIEQVTTLYRDRQGERRRYLEEEGEELAHDFFPRLNVILDEANETRMNIDKKVWEAFMQTMGSGARKVGISLWLICQSALIKNLGGSTVMRRNFTVFALDHETIAELIEDEDHDKARRELVLSRVTGMDFPACMVDRGASVLLDRTGIERARIDSARDLMWEGWQPKARREYQQATVAKTKDDGTVRASVSAGIVYPAGVTSTNGRIAWLLKNGYSYRRIETELSVSHATIALVSKALQRQNGAVRS